MFNTTHIDPAMLNHPTYQRPTDMKKVDVMADSYDGDALGAVTVSKRADGSLWIVDGAHRAAAALKRGDKRILANVHTGLTVAEEAELFLKLNDTKKVSAIDRFKASVISGDPTSVDINRLVESHGWIVSAGGKDGGIAAVTSLEFLYRGGGEVSEASGPNLLNETLSVIRDAWGASSDGVAAMLLRGVGRMLGRYGTYIDGNKIRTKLRKQSPAGLYADARTLAKVSNISMADSVGKVIVNSYNVRMTQGALPEWEVRK